MDSAFTRIMLLRPIPGIVYSHNSSIFIAYSIPLYEWTVNEILVLFLLGAIINNAVSNVLYMYPDMHIYTYTFPLGVPYGKVWHIHLSHKCDCQVIKDGSSEMQTFNYLESNRNNTKLFPKMVVPIYISSSSLWEFQ